MKISAVIPTRNRPLYLRKVLDSILAQTCAVHEIIVIDSSDHKEGIKNLRKIYAGHPIIWIDSIASVCLQRNAGINAASGDWVLLSDDDIEFPQDYLEQLRNFARQNQRCGALAGRLLEWSENNWVDQYPVKNFGQLLWRFIFQLHVWGDLRAIRPSLIASPLFFLVKRFYDQRQNGFSLAGWPLITNWDGCVIQTSVYSLGANLIRKEWLLESPYDEVLDPSGIGDNYGVALGFPGKAPIHILTSTYAYHHRVEQNRVEHSIAYYRRILALHYFIRRNSEKFSSFTCAFFIWSLLGKCIFFLAKWNGKMLAKTLTAIWLILRDRNPYWLGFVNKRKIVRPE